MPILDLFVKVIEHSFRNQNTISTGILVTRCSISIAGIFVLYLVTFFTLRFFTLNVPTDHI